jgi:hypothetical protein
MVQRGVIFAMLFYLTCAVAATIYVSLLYLNDEKCDCRDYMKRLVLRDGLEEHNHLLIPTKNSELHVRDSSIDTRNGKETNQGKFNNINKHLYTDMICV